MTTIIMQDKVSQNYAKLLKAVEYSATVLTIVGYTLITQQFLLLGFAVSLVSNVLWVFWASQQLTGVAWGIVIVNCFLALSGIAGIVKIML